MERAAARFAALGVKARPETAKSDKGKLKAIYLELEIGGFAIHLVKA